MIDAREPLKKENVITPISMIRIQKIFSRGDTPEMSPYPTVVIVVTV